MAARPAAETRMNQQILKPQRGRPILPGLRTATAGEGGGNPCHLSDTLAAPYVSWSA